MLGGSAAQVNAIKHAKKLGLHVVLCDYLTDNPGQYVADEYIPVSTTDEKAVLKIAEQQKIDGIVAYASDPAAPTAAYVGNALELPSNPYESVVTLCHKDRYRKFLRKSGFHAPEAASFTSCGEALDFFHSIGEEALVKPTDSSGSKGVSWIQTKEDFEKAFHRAMAFSRCKRVLVEQPIRNKYSFILGGDGFIVDGELRFACLMNCHRDAICNPLVPTGKSSPSVLPANENDVVFSEISKALALLDMKMGALNLEVIIDIHDKIFLLEIGPRNGGNLIPEQIRFLTGIDMVDLTIRSTMGMDCSSLKQVLPQGCVASHVIHSRATGVLKKLQIDPWLEEKIFYRLLYKKVGDDVERFDGANQALGILMMRFDEPEEMQDTLNTIYERHICIEVEPK